MSRTSVPPSTAPADQIGTTRRWLVLVIASLGMLVVELDTTIVNIALPSIQRDLGFSPSGLQWIINAFLLCFGGFVLLAGRAADLFGRKRLFVTGMVAFGLGSLLSAVAFSPAALIAGRGLQGLGGAMLTSTALSILTTTFTDPSQRNKALGVWSAILTGAVALGLILGGVITGTLSWRWIFFINLPIAAIAIAGALRLVPESTGDTAARHLDLPGAVTITGAIAALIYALTNAPASGWASTQTVMLLLAAAAGLTGFVLIESRSRFPLVRPGIFRVRTLTVGNLGFFLTSGGMYGMFFFSSLYVQDVLGYSPLWSGLALLPLTVGVIIGASVAQPFMRRLGVRVTALVGLSFGVAGGLLLARITVEGDYTTVFLPGLFALALGIGLSMVPFTALATSGVAEHEAGLASGLYNAVGYVGGGLGLAILSTIATARTSSLTSSDTTAKASLAAQLSGYHLAYLTAAAFFVVGALLITTLLRRRHVADIDASTSTAKE